MKKTASFAALALSAFTLSALLTACSSNSDALGSHDAGSDQASIRRDTSPPSDTPLTPDTNLNPDLALDGALPIDTTSPIDTTTSPIDTNSATQPTLITVVLDAASASVAVGAAIPITATAFYSDSSSTEVSASAVWSVTPSTAATITAAGVLTGVAAGAATVQATFGGKTGTLAIMVTATDLKLTAITVTAAATSVDVGNTVQLAAQGTYSDGSKADVTKTVTWTSSAPTLATVSTQGVATAVAAGAVSVKATLDGKEGSVSITVTVPTATLASIAVTAPSSSVDIGATLALVATGTYSDSSKKNISASVTWTSSDATIATVSAAGVVTGVKEGDVTIKAALSGKEGTVAVKVTTPVALSSVTVTASASTVTVGGKVQVTASAVYSDGSKKDATATATWTSGTTTVATVDANGQVTAVKAGSVTITAAFGGKSGSVTLTITDVPLTAIQVTPANPSIPAGTTQQFKATGTYADGSKRDVTGEVDWTSSAADKATISGTAPTKGLATSKAKGTTTITAALSGKSDSTVLTVTDATLTQIVLSPAQPVIAKNTTIAIAATGNYSDGATRPLTALVTWTSSAHNVATVSNADGSNGVVTGQGAGTATITATYTGVSGTVDVKVNDVSLKSLAIKPAGNASLSKGSTLQFSVIGTFSDQSTQDVTTLAAWSSSDPTVATVGDGGGKDGLATALKVGQTTIRADLFGQNASLTLTVTAAALDTITLAPLQPTIPMGLTVQFTATGNYKDGTQQNITSQVTWSSSTTAIATVGASSGLATAKAAGSTTIRADLGTISANTTLTVTSATLSSIAVTQASPSVPVGGTITLTATGTFSDNTTQDLSTQVLWTCSDYTVATVSNDPGSQGSVQTLKAGKANIVATFQAKNVSGQSALTVTPRVTIKAPDKIAKGTTAALVATLITTADNTNPQDITATATWTSSNPGIATFSLAPGTQGRITGGAAAGSTVITAVKDGSSAQVTLQVTNTTLSSLVIQPATPPTIKVGDSTPLALAAIGTFADNSTQDLTIQAVWSSDHPAIATVDNLPGSEGNVTGVAEGTATITAATPTKTANATVTVTP